MSQDTSIEAFRVIQSDLGERQQQVYQAFKYRAPSTNLEISTFLKIPINQITPRTNELVKMGLIAEYKRGKCPISGRRAIFWTTA